MHGNALVGFTRAAGAALILLLPALAGTAQAQSASESASAARAEGGVPVTELIAMVAKKTGKKFVVGPQVTGNIVLIGQEPNSVSYKDLLTILRAYDFTAIEYGDQVSVIAAAGVRHQAIPLLTGKESYPDSQFVSTVITVKNVPAAQLVPILRPILPQVAHLAALPCANKLILVDTYANVRRLEAVINALDVGEEPYTEKCGPYVPPKN